MAYELKLTEEAISQVASLKKSNPKKHKKVAACLAKLENNPKHPGLRSHQYESLDKIYNQKVWESYVENDTPGAYRVFWFHGPGKGEITVVSITPHP